MSKANEVSALQPPIKSALTNLTYYCFRSVSLAKPEGGLYPSLWPSVVDRAGELRRGGSGEAGIE